MCQNSSLFRFPGLEFVERYLQISASSQREVKEGMVFNIDIGLQNIPSSSPSSSSSSSSPSTYSIKISDTFLVTSAGAVALTTTPKNYSDVAYILEEEEEKGKKGSDKKGGEKKKEREEGGKKKEKERKKEELDLAAAIGGR